jgi:hypothetical protein
MIILKYLRSLASAFFIDKRTKSFVDFCIFRWQKLDIVSRKSQVLVELYPLDQTILAFSYFANILAEKHQSKIVSFSLSERNTTLFWLRYRRIIKIYQSFNVRAHINTNPSNSNLDKEAAAIFRDIVNKINNKSELLDVEINGDMIGNEIYEAYLIEKRKPTIDIHSNDFRHFLRKCIQTYLFWHDYFDSHHVTAVILSHGIYRYGIIKTIANKKGVPVYLPTVRSLYCLKSCNEWGIPKYELYPELFKGLPQETRSKGIAWAKNRLELRLSGAVGVDMSYSTQSAFRSDLFSSKVLRESGRIKVLIATHCFFDNPNAYGRNLFPDFYEWIKFLGEMSEITEYDWYLKTHPDVLPGNDKVLNDLLTKYKNIIYLPPATSHLQLAEEGVSFVLTVYGSVGHECPLLGQTVINAGEKNPHIGYNFNIHINTVEEYRSCLLNLEKIETKVDKEKIYEFYFMHYKYSGSNNIFFDSFQDFLSKYSVYEQASSCAYQYFLEEYSKEKDAILYRKLERFIDSSDYQYYEQKVEFN